MGGGILTNYMKKIIISIAIVIVIWFGISFIFARGSTCGFCVTNQPNFAKSEYVCLGKRIEQTSEFMDGGNTIKCLGFALPIKECYYFTGTGNSESLERHACDY